jgi:hypothetical protein
MVIFTLIVKEFEHVAKNLSLLQNVCLEFIFFALFNPGG